MLFKDLSDTPASLSEALSERLLKELFESDWRCYSSALDHLDLWVDAFLATHSRIPGVVKGVDGNDVPIWSSIPLQVMRFYAPSIKLMAEGVLYINGAVVVLHQGQLKPVVLLFIDEQNAQYWCYPEHNYVVFTAKANKIGREVSD